MFDPTIYTAALASFLPHPLLFTSVSGAHLYGFDSPDSDVDLRGCHILPITDLLGLDEPRLTLDRMTLVDGVEVDLVSHDLKKYVRKARYLPHRRIAPRSTTSWCACGWS